MMRDEKAKGFFVICDSGGMITDVLVNGFGGELPLSAGDALAGRFSETGLEKLLNFLLEVKQAGIALNWEIPVTIGGKINLMRFYGALEHSRILLIASTDHQLIFDEMMKISNEQINLFRSFIKPIIEHSTSKPADYEKVYNEISVLNNELVNTQRELFKKNSELSRLNEELRSATEKLSISNQELDNYASVVSHDLKNPLVSIMSFLRLLDNEMRPHMNESMEMLTLSVHATTERMLKMIDELLNFSRLSKNPVVRKNISLEKLIADVKENLDALIDHNSASITHDRHPEMVADEGQLVRLFQNLFQNAIRYRGDNDPRIHVSAVEGPESWTFHVKDNGIGIDPKHFKKIFKIFKTITKNKESVGIGLTVCRKIVENHGGRIWVQSEPGKGATFIFTIKKNYTDNHL